MPLRRLLTLAAIVLFALSAWAVVVGTEIPREIVRLEPDAERSDESLYETIAHRVADGESYYTAAVEEQSAAGYPTSPPPAIRLPTTTWVVAALADVAPWALRALITAAAVASMFRLERISATRSEWIGSTLLLAGSIGMFAHPQAVFVPEAWAICLMILSLALHRRHCQALSPLLGLLAVCFRELAMPFLLVMALLAWRRRPRESAMWILAVIAAGALYLAHWTAASRAALDVASIESPGWLWLGGWPHVVDTFAFSSLLRTLPYEAAVVALPLSILGWLAVRGDHRDHALATSLAFMVIFLFVGRPDTAYWGRLYVPLLIPGLAFAPRAVSILIRGERPDGRASAPPGRLDP